MARPRKQKIEPQDVKFENDEVMPMPETANYDAPAQAPAQNNGTVQVVKPTAKFLKLFEECLGKLPYNTILSNSQNERIKLTDLMNYVNSKQGGMLVSDMDSIISFIAPVEYSIVKPLMEIIESAERQPELWALENMKLS